MCPQQFDFQQKNLNLATSLTTKLVNSFHYIEKYICIYQYSLHYLTYHLCLGWSRIYHRESLDFPHWWLFYLTRIYVCDPLIQGSQRLDFSSSLNYWEFDLCETPEISFYSKALFINKSIKINIVFKYMYEILIKP